MQLTELLPREEWIEFEKKLHQHLGLDVNVFDPEGIRITDYKQWVNRLCPVIKADDRGQSFICAVAHMNIAGEARRSQKAVLEACDVGLLKIVVPIFQDDTFIGAVGACGLLLENEEVDTFLLNKTMDLDEEETQALCSDLGSISHQTVEAHIACIREQLESLFKRAGLRNCWVPG